MCSSRAFLEAATKRLARSASTYQLSFVPAKPVRHLWSYQLALRHEAHGAASGAQRDRVHRHWRTAMIRDLHADDLGAVESLLAEVPNIPGCSRLLNWACYEAAAALHAVEQLGLRASSREKPLSHLPSKRQPGNEQRDARDDERNSFRTHGSSLRMGTDI